MILAKTTLFLILSYFLVACDAKNNSADNSTISFQQFSDIYEPSGVVQLSDGRLLLVEDEKDSPFSLLQLDEANNFHHLSLSNKVQSKDGTKIKIKLDDLEGITVGEEGWIYAITSHSRTAKGKRKKHRERLVRFRIVNNEIHSYQYLPSLTTALAKLLSKKSIAKLNIEGLAYDAKNHSLLLGLRRPLINKSAIIIQLNNIDKLFESRDVSTLSANVITLDLQGKSIRSIDYDSVLRGYLIVAGSKKGRRDPFKLWLWKNNQLKSVKITDLDDIAYTEGVTSIKDVSGNEALLLVSDDGQKGEAAGHYMILSYDRLQISQ